IKTISLDKTSFDCSNLGANTVTLTVEDVNGNTSSKTATVTVEDKIAPVVITKNISISLNATGTASIVANDINNGSYDVCGNTLSYTLDKTLFNCSNVGPNTVTLTVKDKNGNSAIKTAIVTILDNTIPVVSTKNISVLLDANGQVTIAPKDVDNGTKDLCGTFTLSLSKSTFDCSNIGANTVTLTATDAIGNKTSKAAVVTVSDKILPIAKAKNTTIYLDVTGKAKLLPEMVDNVSTDNCLITKRTTDKVDFTCSNIGANTVKLSVFDATGNTSSASCVVTVLDTMKPKVLAKNISIKLTSSTLALTATQIDNGTSDNCGIKTLTVSPSSFNCSHVGNQTVTLTAVDNSGNTAQTTAVVTIQKDAPIVKTKNITVLLNAASEAAILPTDINNGTTDICGALVYSIDKSKFDCSNVGPNTITFSAKDVCGNTGSATAIVTVQEKVLPVVKLKNYVANLSALGTVVVDFSNIDNGTTDNCGIKSVVLDKSSFNCSNIGANAVKVTVTDNAGNVSSATTTVTVMDNIAPVARVKDLTVSLVNGTYTLTPAVINNGTTDNCGIKTMTVTPTVFNCSQIGTHTITFTVTDNSGNISTAISKLTVLGVVPTCNVSLSSGTTPYKNDLKTIYLGFSNQTVDLTCNTQNGTTFTTDWTGQYLSASSGQKVTFKPTVPGKFTLLATSKNQFGCQTQCNVEICVQDVRSTDVSGMVLVCHQSEDGLKRTLSVSATDAAKMLAQYPNDAIGVCNTDCNTLPITRKVVDISNTKSLFSVPGYVIAQNPYTNGTGWSAALYTPTEMTNKGSIKGVNVLSSLRWRVDRDMNYGSQHRIYRGVNIYVYHYGKNLTFPNTNKPTLPAEAIKVFSGDLDFQLPDMASCFMDVPFNMSNFYYDGVSSVVVYIEKTIPIIGSSVTDPWASYNEDADPKKIRFVGNWSGLNFTTSNYNSTLKQNRYPQVIFNDTKTTGLCDKSIYNVSASTTVVTTTVYPNPTSTEFNLKFESSSSELVELRVYDLAGTQLLLKTGLTPNQIITFGQELSPGMFIVEVKQGTVKRTIKVYKI
ncbi:MAG: T9SS C-terminal target domain-containing protein, partial [Crocinitomicaceae bacterium]|nr:T9SS C-terminal target domain-containing protein [Crocinitomicaceae bacterium]